MFPLCKIQKCISLSNANTKDQTFHGDRVLRPQITVVLTSNEFSKTRQKFLYKCKYTAVPAWKMILLHNTANFVTFDMSSEPCYHGYFHGLNIKISEMDTDEHGRVTNTPICVIKYEYKVYLLKLVLVLVIYTSPCSCAGPSHTPVRVPVLVLVIHQSMILCWSYSYTSLCSCTGPRHIQQSVFLCWFTS